MMDFRAIPVVFLVFFQSYVQSQSLEKAIIKTPLTKAKVGDTAIWSCDSENLPLQLCLWERTSSPGGASFIISFNPANARPGLFSGTNGYSYSGDGLRKGQCGLQIDSVNKTDFGNWQCTLFSETQIYRGNVELVMSEEQPQEPILKVNATSSNNLAKFRILKLGEGVASPIGSVSPVLSRGSVSLIIPPEYRDSRQIIPPPAQIKPKTQLINKPQQHRNPPIITGPVHSNDQPEIYLPTSAIIGTQVSEVKVESTHLQIRKSKLQTY